MAQVGLKGPGVVALVGQRKAARVAQHDDFGECLHHFCQLGGLRRRQVAPPNRLDKGTHSRNRVAAQRQGRKPGARGSNAHMGDVDMMVQISVADDIRTATRRNLRQLG